MAVITWIVTIALKLASLCTPKQTILLSRGLARVQMWVRGETYTNSRANLSVCFPELSAPATHALTELSLTHMSLLFFEMAQLRYWSEDRLLGQIKEERGREVLQEAFESQQGVLLLVPHFGNWELLCAYLGVHFSVAALYDPPKLAGLEPVLIQARQRYQGKMFPIDAGGMRSLLKELKQGGLVAVLPDQVPRRHAGVYADFFGRPALTMTLGHRLAQRSGVQVIMGYVQRDIEDEQLSYRLCFDRLDDLDTSNEQRCMGMINQRIEQIVRRAPEQYQWEYKRFKRPPGDTQSIYRRQ